MAAPGWQPREEDVWQPREEDVHEICCLLRQHIAPTSDKSSIIHHLQQYSHFQDFNNNLAFILGRLEGEFEIRQAAGLLLKNNLKTSFRSVYPAYQKFIKAELLRCLGAADRNIRSTAGTVISVIVQQGLIAGWPELLHALVQCLDSNNLDHMQGAMDAISKICEDIPQGLDSDVPGLGERPINVLLPRLFQLFESPHDTLRELSLRSINQFIMQMPMALHLSMNRFLQGLFVLSNDPAGEVRKLVCAAYAELVVVRIDILQPHLKVIIGLMLQASRDRNGEVALKACEFWSSFCKSQENLDLLKEFLPYLPLVLLKNMAYADDDEILVKAEEDDSLPDRDQDMKPRFHSSRLHGSEEDTNDDDDSFNIWNLRKCSAASIATISNNFGVEILPILMPLIEAKLSSCADESWKEREAAVLALGVISKGRIIGLYPRLSKILELLIPRLDDKFPLVRSKTCWTLSRFSKIIVRGIGNRKGREQFNKVLVGLLQRILDTNKRVQEAACSSFSIFGEKAAKELVPHLETILQHLVGAFGRYQRRNQLLVYDAIGTLADAVGAELNQTRYLDILMPPLISKWQQLSDWDKDLFPLLECFTLIVKALGPGFSKFAPQIFLRCMIIIHSQLLAKVNPEAAGVQYVDNEFIVCVLDLLSALAGGLGSTFESVFESMGVKQRLLRNLLMKCCKEDAPSVRQSAFGLLSNLARVYPTYLQPYFYEFVNIAAKQLETSQLSENVLVATNACWAIGELVVKVPEDISPIVDTIVSYLDPILHVSNSVNRSLVENSAITLGRLAWICPDMVAPHMERFMKPWCISLSMIQDSIVKEEAFHGLCALVCLNPEAALTSLVHTWKCIASWQVIRSRDLHNDISWVLLTYKQLLGDEAWEQCMSMLEPLERDKLSKYNQNQI